MKWLSLITIPIATWMVIETHRSFPGDPLFELLPGYLFFPGMVLGLGIAWWKVSVEYDEMRKR